MYPRSLARKITTRTIHCCCCSSPASSHSIELEMQQFFVHPNIKSAQFNSANLIAPCTVSSMHRIDPRPPAPSYSIDDITLRLLINPHRLLKNIISLNIFQNVEKTQERLLTCSFFGTAEVAKSEFRVPPPPSRTPPKRQKHTMLHSAYWGDRARAYRKSSSSPPEPLYTTNWAGEPGQPVSQPQLHGVFTVPVGHTVLRT